VLGLPLNPDAASTSAVALTLLAGTPALTFTAMIGAVLAVTLHRGGLLPAVLVLPLSIPVLIFGVAASRAVISGPLSFGTPFSMLCALSVVSFVVGPFAAAASLRHGLDWAGDWIDVDQPSQGVFMDNMRLRLLIIPPVPIRMP
jgi:heme exporter protein B